MGRKRKGRKKCKKKSENKGKEEGEDFFNVDHAGSKKCIYVNEVIKAKHEMALNLCEDGTIVSSIKADDSFVSAKIDAYRKEYKYMSDGMLMKNEQENEEVRKKLKKFEQMDLDSRKAEKDVWKEVDLYRNWEGWFDGETRYEAKSIGPLSEDSLVFKMHALRHSVYDLPLPFPVRGMVWDNVDICSKSDLKDQSEIRAKMHEEYEKIMEMYNCLFFLDEVQFRIGNNGRVFSNLDITNVACKNPQVSDVYSSSSSPFGKYIEKIFDGDLDYVTKNFKYEYLRCFLNSSTGVLTAIFKMANLDMFNYVIKKIQNRNHFIVQMILEKNNWEAFECSDESMKNASELMLYFTSVHLNQGYKVDKNICYLIDMLSREKGEERDLLYFRAVELGAVHFAEYIYGEEFRIFWEWFIEYRGSLSDDKVRDINIIGEIILHPTNLAKMLMGVNEMYTDSTLLYRIYKDIMLLTQHDCTLVDTCINFFGTILPKYFQESMHPEEEGLIHYPTKLFDINGVIDIKERYFDVLGINGVSPREQKMNYELFLDDKTAFKAIYKYSAIPGLIGIKDFEYVEDQLFKMHKVIEKNKLRIWNDSKSNPSKSRLPESIRDGNLFSTVLDVMFRDGFYYNVLHGITSVDYQRKKVQKLISMNKILYNAVIALGGNTNFNVTNYDSFTEPVSYKYQFCVSQKTLTPMHATLEEVLASSKGSEKISEDVAFGRMSVLFTQNLLRYSKVLVLLRLSSSLDDVLLPEEHLIEILRKKNMMKFKDHGHSLKKGGIEKLKMFFKDYAAMGEAIAMLSEWDIRNKEHYDAIVQIRFSSAYRSVYLQHVWKNPNDGVRIFVQEILNSAVLVNRYMDNGKSIKKKSRSDSKYASNAINNCQDLSIKPTLLQFYYIEKQKSGFATLRKLNSKYLSGFIKKTEGDPSSMMQLRVEILMNKFTKQKFDEYFAIMLSCTNFSFLHVNETAFGISANKCFKKGDFVLQEGDHNDVIVGTSLDIDEFRNGSKILPSFYLDQVKTKSWAKFGNKFKSTWDVEDVNFFDISVKEVEDQFNYGIMEIPGLDFEKLHDGRNRQVMSTLIGERWEVKNVQNGKVLPYFVVSKIGSQIRHGANPNVRPWFVLDTGTKQLKGWIYWEAIRPIFAGESLVWDKKNVYCSNSRVKEIPVVDHVINFLMYNLKLAKDGKENAFTLKSVWDLHRMCDYSGEIVERGMNDSKKLFLLKQIMQCIDRHIEKKEIEYTDEEMKALNALFNKQSNYHIFTDSTKKKHFDDTLNPFLKISNKMDYVANGTVVEAAVMELNARFYELFRDKSFLNFFNKKKVRTMIKLLQDGFLQDGIMLMGHRNALRSGWSHIIYDTKGVAETLLHLESAAKGDLPFMNGNYDAMAVNDDLDPHTHTNQFFKTELISSFNNVSWSGTQKCKDIGSVSLFQELSNNEYLGGYKLFTLSNFAMSVIYDLMDIQDQGDLLGHHLFYFIGLQVLNFFIDDRWGYISGTLSEIISEDGDNRMIFKRLNNALKGRPFIFSRYVRGKQCLRPVNDSEKCHSYKDWYFPRIVRDLFDQLDHSLYFGLDARYEVETFILKYINHLSSLDEGKNIRTRNGGVVNWEMMRKGLHRILIYNPESATTAHKSRQQIMHRRSTHAKLRHQVVFNNQIYGISFKSGYTRRNEMVIDEVSTKNIMMDYNTYGGMMYSMLLPIVDETYKNQNPVLMQRKFNELRDLMHNHTQFTEKNILNCGILFKLTSIMNDTDRNSTGCKKFCDDFSFEWHDCAQFEFIRHLKKSSTLNVDKLSTSGRRKKNKVICFRSRLSPIESFCGNFNIGAETNSRNKKKKKKRDIVKIISKELELAGVGQIVFNNGSQLWGNFNKRSDLEYNVTGTYFGNFVVDDELRKVWVGNAFFISNGCKLNLNHGVMVFGRRVSPSSTSLKIDSWFNEGSFPQDKGSNCYDSLELNHLVKSLHTFNAYHNISDNSNVEAIYMHVERLTRIIAKNAITKPVLPKMEEQTEKEKKKIQRSNKYFDIAQGIFSDLYYGDFVNYKPHGDDSLYISRGTNYGYSTYFKNIAKNFGGLLVSAELQNMFNCDGNFILNYDGKSFNSSAVREGSELEKFGKTFCLLFRHFGFRLIGSFENGEPHGKIKIELFSGAVELHGSAYNGSLKRHFKLFFSDGRKFDVTLQNDVPWGLMDDDGTRTFYDLSDIIDCVPIVDRSFFRSQTFKNKKKMLEEIRAGMMHMKMDVVTGSLSTVEVLMMIHQTNTDNNIKLTHAVKKEFYISLRNVYGFTIYEEFMSKVNPQSKVENIEKMKLEKELKEEEKLLKKVAPIITETKSSGSSKKSRSPTNISKSPVNMKSPSNNKKGKNTKKAKFLSTFKLEQQKKKKKSPTNHNNNMKKGSSGIFGAKKAREKQKSLSKLEKENLENKKKLERFYSGEDKKYASIAAKHAHMNLMKKNVERLKKKDNQPHFVINNDKILLKLSTLIRSRVPYDYFGRNGLSNEEKIVYAYVNVHKEGTGNMTKVELLNSIVDIYQSKASVNYIYVNVGRSNLITDDNLRTYLFNRVANPDYEEGNGIVVGCANVWPNSAFDMRNNSNFCDLLIKINLHRLVSLPTTRY